MGDPLLTSGSLIANRFEIRELGGSGGMGVVYRARDRYTGEFVALKLLHGSGAGEDRNDRFAREVQLLSELRHPGIVSYVAHGQTQEGQLFLAMEWLDGQDLGQYLLRGPLPLSDCLRLVDQVAAALSVAHQRGIIHRDLKPQNLFLVGGLIENVKLVDFGIARLVANARPMTRTGTIVGTPEYMAPEQARGSSNLTPAVDYFSLGCLLYECLTGKPPFVAETIAAVFAQILFQQPVPIDAYRPGFPAALGSIIDQLLAKDPMQRLADAPVLRARLAALAEIPEPALAGTMGPARPASPAFGQDEQSLFSLILAVPPDASDWPIAHTAPSGGPALLAGPERQSLEQALVALGASPNFLAHGALIVTVPCLGSAQDQAVLAARAALCVKARWPSAIVSLATGRGIIHGSTAVGEVVDRAAQGLRVGGLPDRGTANSGVLLDALSAKLLEGRFEQTPQPDGALLLGEESEADASRPLLGKPTPCVGREMELSLLDAQLTSCIEESDARVVLLTGPPGVGKSRLRHEFLRRVEQRSDGVTVIVGRGDFMSAGAPNGILGNAVRQLCGLAGGEPLAVQQSRIAARVGGVNPTPEGTRLVEFIGELCGVPFQGDGSERLAAARRDQSLMRAQVRRAFVEWLAAECKAAPVLLVLDDLQWGDSLSIELLDEALRELRSSPLLLLALARPEVRGLLPALSKGHKLLEMPLSGLSRKAAERLVQHVLGKQVAPEVVSRIAEQSAGNALFLEELIRDAAQGKSAEKPTTIVAMLQARITRLDAGPRKAVRAASVYGQTFWRGGVLALLDSRTSVATVDQWLDTLVEAELIMPFAKSRLAREREYGFRHALVREAAYSLLTDSDLTTGHGLASHYLEQAGETDATVIAEHSELGGETQRAITFFCRAAEQTLNHLNLSGTLARVERALRLRPDGLQLGRLYAMQSQALMWTNEIPAAFSAGQQALSLLPPGDSWWCCIIGALMTIASNLDEPGPMNMLTSLFASVDPAQAEPGPYVLAAARIIMQLGLVGASAQIRTLLAAAQRTCADLPPEDQSVRATLDTCRAWQIFCLEPNLWLMYSGVQRSTAIQQRAQNWQELMLTLLVTGVAQAELGNIALGIKTTRECVALAERLQTPTLALFGRLYLLFLLGWEAQEETRAEAQQLIADCQSAPLPTVRGLSLVARAQYALRQGSARESESYARSAIAHIPLMKPYQLWAMTILIQAINAQGSHAEALAMVGEALQVLSGMGGAGFVEVPLRTVAAEAYYGAGDFVRAETELHEALRQISLRADSIPEADWRSSYLLRNPFCARACDLARQWRIPGFPALPPGNQPASA